MAKHHHYGKEHNPPHRGFMTLLGTSMHMHHTGEYFFSLTFSFTFHLHIMLTGALYINHRYWYRYLPADENPHLFILHHSYIGLTLHNTCRIYFLIHQNVPNPLNYRLTNISRQHQMYVTVVQKISIPLEVLVSLFDSYNNLVPTKLLHFFLRTLLLTTILYYIKSEHLWYAYMCTCVNAALVFVRMECD